MLYLNLEPYLKSFTFNDLTLTSVVFEYNSFNTSSLNSVYLTLTSVVFEFEMDEEVIKKAEFNFNKCCI